MPLSRLDHYSIRTAQLAKTERFYTEVLGLEVGPRPNFPFPGVWLHQGGDTTPARSWPRSTAFLAA